jgi:hypothetical protein
MSGKAWKVYEVKNADEFLRAICREWNKVFQKLRSSYWRNQFRKLWASNATESEFYELAAKIHLVCYGKKLSRERWAKAWQYRLILHPDFSEAIREFAKAIIGFY